MSHTHTHLLRQLTKDVRKREFSSVWLHQVRQKTQRARQTLVQAPRTVRCSRMTQKFLVLKKLGELVGAMQVTLVTGQSIHEQEDISATGHSVTDARTFLQQPSLPRDLSESFARL